MNKGECQLGDIPEGPQQKLKISINASRKQ